MVWHIIVSLMWIFVPKKTYTCLLQKTSISTSIHGKMSQIFKKYAKIGYIDIIY